MLKRRSRFLTIILFLITGFIWLQLSVNQASLSQSEPSSSYAKGQGGAVATVDPYATQVGIEILRQGGNAIDAAVATAAALGVVRPFSCGIGGGGFMVIYLKNANRIVTIDGREQAPAAIQISQFQDANTGDLLPFFPNRVSSGASVGVPGTVLEWTEALNRYGTLSLAETLQPAIKLAEQGFELNSELARQITFNQTRFSAFRSTRDLYLPKGQVPKIGSRFTNPDLAKTYRLLSERGSNVFYRGDIAEAIVETVQNPPTVADPPFSVKPGVMTLTDLDQYGVRVRPPSVTDYRGYTLYSMGLPSSGGITTGEILNILSHSEFTTLSPAQVWHQVIEAERLAFADRNAYLGDPEYVDVPLAGLTSSAFATKRWRSIGDRAPDNEADFRAAPGNPLPYQSDPSPSLTTPVTVTPTTPEEGMSTTHLVVSDRAGNVVSYTLTIELTGGSGMVVPGYGFILNNELTDFDLTVPHPNTPEPGKHPRSSMAPTIAVSPDGEVLAFGSPGGSTIITTVAGLAVNLIDFKLPLDQAIRAPRFSQRNQGATWVDGGLEKSEMGQALRALGHTLIPSPFTELGAAVGLVVHSNGDVTAAAESNRRGGGSAMIVQE